MSLIPDEMMATIRAAGEWDDEDVWFLGGGRRATYDEGRGVFVVQERQEGRWKFLGEVPLSAVRGAPPRRDRR